MDKGLYVAMTGARASLQAQATVAHNLANVETVGFKAGVVGTEAFRIPGAGVPSRIDAVPTQPGFDARSGAETVTGNALDVALHEHRWLAVQAADGREAYTRAGELTINANGLLTTASGRLVLDDGSAPLALPPYQSLQIGGDGTVSIVPQGEGPETLAIVGRLRVVEAAPQQLTRGADGLMRNADPQTPLAPAAGTVLTSGALEGSNADAAGMLVQMIQLQRQFELQVRVIRSGDENAQSANTLLRLGA